MEDLVVPLLHLRRLMLARPLFRDMEVDPLLLLQSRDMVVVLLPLSRLLDMVVGLQMLVRVNMGLLRLGRPHDMVVGCLLVPLEEQVAMEHLWEDVMEELQQPMAQNKIVLVPVSGRLVVEM
jgi:hypothetical protein